MARKRSNRWTVFLCLALVVSGIGGMATLIVIGVPAAERVPETKELPRERIPEPFRPPVRLELSQLPLVREAREEPQPRRFPVAGAQGYSIVVNPDGTSYMDGPDGKQQLVDRTQLALPDERELNRRIADRLRRSSEPVAPQKEGLGQLIVLDDGVVDIPKGLIVTFTAADRLVTLNTDGSSTVYYVSGKVERRERERPKDGQPPPPPRPPPPKKQE